MEERQEVIWGKQGEWTFFEVSPPGFEGTVKAMKARHPEIDNPWALAWWMKKKGYKSHKTKDGKNKSEVAMNFGEWLKKEIQ